MYAPLPAPLLRAHDVSFAVGGKTLIDGVDFALGRGSLAVLLGPNGAGKSLTLRLCHELLRPTSGRIEWPRRSGKAAAPRHAMVFQRPILLRRSASANIIHAGALAGLGYRERRRRAGEALDHFGLGPLAHRNARTLSGGEQQRLAIARAWSLRPDVLFLDEPTASLDPAATKAVEEMIRACHADGMTVLMSTHDLGQARRMGEHVLFLHRGRLVEQARGDAFFAGPRTPEASAFLGGDLIW